MRSSNSLSIRSIAAVRDRWSALDGDYETTPNRVQFEGPIAVLGRDPGVHLPVKNAKLDPCHLRFQLEPHGWTVTDLGSAGGTIVGGVPLRAMKPRDLPERSFIELPEQMFLETTHGKRPFEQWARAGHPDVARASLLGAKARRDELPVLLLLVEGPIPLPPFPLRPRAKRYNVGRSRICEVSLPGDEIVEEAFSIIATENDDIAVENYGKQAIFLGHRRLPVATVNSWPRLAMLRVGPYVFALADPVSVAIEEAQLQHEGPMTVERVL